MQNNKKHVVVLGSTGSIGSQTLDVIRQNPDDFVVAGLVAYSNVEVLNQQASEFKPALGATNNINEIEKMVTNDQVDIVVVACSGMDYYPIVLKAIRAKKKIAIANKRMIAENGEELMEEVKKHQTKLVPIDSEHSGIFQCLEGRDKTQIEKVILTCSGGPFLNTPAENFHSISIEEALNHPKWKMGKQITIDSATLMNKAIEIIEAKYLFDLEPDQIEVLVHPQCIVHALVQFKDGSLVAHLGYPDMRLPISYALYYPEIKQNLLPRPDLTKTSLEFFKPDTDKFPSINFAYRALREKGDFSKKLNKANEEAVDKFLKNEITFPEIFSYIQKNTFI